MKFIFFTLFIPFFITTAVEAIAFHVKELPEVMFLEHYGPLNEKALNKMEIVDTIIVKFSNITNLHGHFSKVKLPQLKKFVFVKCFFDMDKTDYEDFFKGATNLNEIHIHQYETYIPMLDEMRSDVAEKIIMTNNVYPTLSGRLLSNTKLKIINLARNEIQKIDEDAFKGLNNVELLILNSNKIESLSKSQLEDLKNAKQILLRDNLMKKIDVQEMPEMPNLVKIDVGHNPLDELKLDGYEVKLPNLKVIDVTGTKFVDQLDDWKKKYPKIKFEVEYVY